MATENGGVMESESEDEVEGGEDEVIVEVKFDPNDITSFC